MRNTYRMLSTITVFACITSLSSCSKNATESNDGLEGADTGQFASSMDDLINSLLDNDQYDEDQKKVLRAALQHDGEIPYASYSAAWESYRQCLADKGYTKPPKNLTNGIYFAPTYVSTEGLTEIQNRKMDDDIDECQDSRVYAVDLAYRTRLGNPEFYGDPEVALVDCLHRKNLVPQNYTMNQYRKEYDSYMNDTSGGMPEDWFSFDFNDGAVLSCLAANKSPLIQSRLEIWKPLG
ncbi:hypothetical protein PG2083B_0799 [Bifidobacterium pseudolongum subsp. globosum]|uniref:Lipoprotein n=3 Tax=Bifidobacterium pseudolongum TaxID=1694 RepID=A0A2N3QYA8_9BIFI|nr:hypothetical protein CQR55_0715 [Bifidobacterium pseudolongum subsp. globosum]PKU98091.1 hypothetical protein CQR56_0453 [Bifidobacterium pseudolongum subsp. globosum]PKV03344.1 hypothetical protein CQR53_0885 [Bifidobacterium pseudolongum subsp. globosum]RYQ18087.1 hypothetical protein PG2083B_0799 [Bifidobacterium pseudolongum subsp. globosum]RYQ44621.1 hypothetical protein PG1791B_0739 [Bifidobacterium pseudolongum subsp. globosum]